MNVTQYNLGMATVKEKKTNRKKLAIIFYLSDVLIDTIQLETIQKLQEYILRRLEAILKPSGGKTS